MGTTQPLFRSSQPHIHVAGAQCPVCDQDIPNEKAELVRQRMEAREKALAETVSNRLKEQFALERVQIEANARAAVEKIQQDNAAALESLQREAGQRESAAREEGSHLARAAAQEQIDALTQAKEQLTLAAEQRIADVQATAAQQIQDLKQAQADALAASSEQTELLLRTQAQALAAANERALHAEQGKADLEAAARERIDAAEAARLAAEETARTAIATHDTILNERLQEQRDALQKDKDAAVLAEQAKTFEERQRLQVTVQQLQGQLAKERADVAGEGAELELFEELKAAFEGDRIRRVPRGTPGADIIHEVVENGQLCGKIVYDSKKRQSWKTEYATKLCEDKIAEGAQHAILSLLKFPADSAKHLCVRDGVILANPARVAALAEILRDHIVSTHGLRLSQQEREKKQGELYAYITSERFQQHLDSIESQTDKLLEVDVAEQKAHRAVWERRGGLLKGLQKAHGNLRADVGRIIGTASPAE
jgi:hypothetical protein